MTEGCQKSRLKIRVDINRVLKFASQNSRLKNRVFLKIRVDINRVLKFASQKSRRYKYA